LEGKARGRAPGLAGKAAQDFTVPQPHHALGKAPVSIWLLDRDVLIPAGEAQGIWRFVMAFGDEGEAAHADAAIVARLILHLGGVVLAAGKSGRVGIMPQQRTNAGMALPDVRLLEHFLHHARVGGETGHQRIGIAGVERPAIRRQQVLQTRAILQR
jgi:hypothetical protein